MTNETSSNNVADLAELRELHEENRRLRMALAEIAAKYDRSRWSSGFGVLSADLATIAREALNPTKGE